MPVDKSVFATLDDMLVAQLQAARQQRPETSVRVQGDTVFQRTFQTLLSPIHRARYVASAQRRHGHVTERFEALFGANVGRHLRVVEQQQHVARQVGSNFSGFGKRNTGRSTLRTGYAQFKTSEGALAVRLRDSVREKAPVEHEHAFVGLRRGDHVHVEVHVDPQRAHAVFFRGTCVCLVPVADLARAGFEDSLWVRSTECVAVSGNTTIVAARVQ